MRHSLRMLLSAALLSAFSSAGAYAATMDVFTFTISGVPGTGTATIAASPTPSSFVSNTSFLLSGVSGTFDGSTFTGDITFYAAGGVMGDGFMFSGPELFSGSVSDPTFTPGTYVLTGSPDLGDGPMPVSVDLTIAAVPSAATPEPASLALVGTAVLLLAGVVRLARGSLTHH